jgi:hypothetical protein
VARRPVIDHGGYALGQQQMTALSEISGSEQ